MDKFYVQDKRQYVGNCILWWRPNGNGYTTNIEDAGVFTEDTLPINRETDIPWRKNYIDQHLRKTVDVQDVENPLRDDPRYKNPRVRAARKQEP